MRCKWNAVLLSLVFFITAAVAEVSACAEMSDGLLRGDDGWVPKRRCRKGA